MRRVGRITARWRAEIENVSYKGSVGMSDRIKVGIVGYGNLGRGAEMAIHQQPDMELVAVFSRRGKVDTVNPDVLSVHVDETIDFKDKIDVLRSEEHTSELQSRGHL